jgi:hypothetical protein
VKLAFAAVSGSAVYYYLLRAGRTNQPDDGD